MTKKEIYRDLEIFKSSDMLLVNNEVIIECKDLNDDWFELSEFSDEEDIGIEYSFSVVKHIDYEENYEKFEDEDNIYETEFSQPMGCIVRFNVLDIIEKYEEK